MMVAALEGDVELDFRVQLQTDPHLMPIENNAVLWPEAFASCLGSHTASAAAEVQLAAQMEFCKRLTHNPWHCMPRASPLGNQSRARRRVLRTFAAAAADERRLPPRTDGRRELRLEKS